MTHKRQIWQVFLSFIIINFIVMMAIVWYTVGKSKNLIKEIYFQELQSKALVVARSVEDDLQPEKYEKINRKLNYLFYDLNSYVTVILPNGKVIADTRKDPSQLDNHADRPEIKEALQGHIGRNIRYSYSVEKDLIYVAVPVYKGGQVIAVVRTSFPYSATERIFDAMQSEIFLFLIVLIILIIIFGYWIARRISAPLEEIALSVERVADGDFSIRLGDFSSKEMHRLAEAFNKMINELELQIKTIDQQKNQQRAIFHSMSEGILAIDHNERIIAINRAVGNLLGISEQAIGRSVQEVVRNSHLLKIIHQALENGDLIEDEIIFREEPLRFVQVHGTSLQNDRNETIGAMVVLNDVTRLRRLEEIRRDFVANVSHEIRTPLTSIKGFVETLLDGAILEKETAERFLKIIYNQTNRLNSIIDDLMVLASLEQKEERAEFQFSEEPLEPVIENAIHVCQSFAEEKKIVVKAECPGTLAVKMNPTLIEQALINLIMNAIKYSPENTEVRVCAEETGNEIVISVIDQGIGIPKEYQERIFERFYRVDKARSRTLGGTGLGLAIVKHIVKVHNGRVGVESKLGKGSTFYIYLPV